MTEREPTPELSRPVATADLSAAETRIDLEATPDQCAALAKRFDLVSLSGLRAVVALRIDPLGDLELHGELRADVTQECVVTFEPVDATVTESFHLRFVRDPEAAEEVGDELPEPWPGSVLDVGEVVAQQLGLAIDPYPRAPGAAVAPAATEAPSAGATPAADESPFAALRSWPGRRG